MGSPQGSLWAAFGQSGVARCQHPSRRQALHRPVAWMQRQIKTAAKWCSLCAGWAMRMAGYGQG